MHNGNVLIVDDHAVMRKGLNVLLNDFYPALKIYEAADGHDLLEAFRQRSIDILVMDIQIPDTDTISLVELESIKYPQTYILVFSVMPERIYGSRLRKAGASAYIPKESTIEQMKQAFDQVIKNRLALRDNTPAVQHSLAPGITTDSSPFATLSFREFEILNYLLDGNNIHEIAMHLKLKPSTVGTYKLRSFNKLKISNIVELKELALLYNLRQMLPNTDNISN